VRTSNQRQVLRLAMAGLLFLAIILTGNVQALTLKPLKVAPNVYAFIGDMGERTYKNEGMNANTGFVVTNAGVVVVDSGSTYRVAKEIHRVIRTMTTQPVKYVINTGGQDHRWLGNGYFKEQGAQILASRAALPDMQERAAMYMSGLKEVLKEKLQGTRPVFPDKLIESKETLKLGDTEIQIMFFHGGHTPGDSVVWLPQRKVLFSGDLIYADRLLGVLPFSNSKNWLMSFEQIEKLNPGVIVPGHGNLCDLDKARRQTRDYLVLLRNHMKRAVDEGTDMQSAINSLDQSAFKHLANYALLKGGNASRVYLEMETE